MASPGFSSIAGRIIPGRMIPGGRMPPISSGGGSLVPGTASAGTIGIHSLVVSATAPTGGTSPYTYRWQQHR